MNIEQFNQQPADVRQHVLERNRNWNVDDNYWANYLQEQLSDDLYALGVTVKQVYWSGFWSQGDGACFNGHTHDMVKLCESVPELKQFADIYELKEVSMSWASRDSYCHEHTLRFEVQDHRYAGDDDDDLTRMRTKLVQIETARVEELEKAVIDWVEDQCRKFYDDLEQEYEHLTSDEQILESLECNDQLEEEVLRSREELGHEL